MKKMFFSLVALAISATVVASPKAPVRYVVNTAQTTLSWNAKKVTGEHSGLVPVQSGELTLENGVFQSGNFVMNLEGMNCTDIKDAGTNAKLMGHLRSDDFFSVKNHPTSTFTITSIAAGSQAGVFNVKGNLTIKGISKPLEFPATILVQNGTLRATADITVDRTEFDIRYGSKKFFESIGDKAIYDEFTLSLQLVATQQ